MKKIITLTAFVALCLPLWAQNASQKRLTREEFRAQQIAFLTERAELTPEEAGAFFPLYFELQDKKAKLNQIPWKKMKKIKETKLSEEECDQMMTQYYDSRIEACQLDKEYYDKFRKALSAQKVLSIQQAELKFRRQMMHGKYRSQASKK